MNNLITVSPEMAGMMEAVNKWLFHSWNYRTVLHKWRTTQNGSEMSEYVPEFLAKTRWTCYFDHILEKWHAATASHDTHSYLSRFYADLDIWNRQRLLEWVLNNYKGQRKLF